MACAGGGGGGGAFGCSTFFFFFHSELGLFHPGTASGCFLAGFAGLGRAFGGGGGAFIGGGGAFVGGGGALALAGDSRVPDFFRLFLADKMSDLSIDDPRWLLFAGAMMRASAGLRLFLRALISSAMLIGARLGAEVAAGSSARFKLDRSKVPI